MDSIVADIIHAWLTYSICVSDAIRARLTPPRIPHRQLVIPYVRGEYRTKQCSSSASYRELFSAYLNYNTQNADKYGAGGSPCVADAPISAFAI